jgi:glucose/mannose-6-phosphate isomerase
MVHVLDTPAYLKKYDRGGMLRVISGFPESCAESIKFAESTDLQGLREGSFDSVVVSGMGGSAMGGVLLRDWLKGTLPLPMVVTGGYRLPGFVGGRTLLFAVSYSGGTEEAISALKDGIGRGAKEVSRSLGSRRAFSLGRRYPTSSSASPSRPGGSDSRATPGVRSTRLFASSGR